MKRIRVAILNNIIAPYKIPLFSELARRKKIDLEVIFLSETASNRRWSVSEYEKDMHFKYTILSGITIKIPFREIVGYIVNPGIFLRLWKGQYDVVITHGWLDFACQMTFLCKFLFGYRYIIWSESTVYEKSIQRTLTLPFVRWAIAHASGYIAVGSRSKEYLISLGADADKIYTAYSTVDIQHFRKKSSLSPRKILKYKKQFGINLSHQVILFVGQFIKRKGVDILLEAFSQLQNKNTTLLFVGYGQEEKYIEEFSASYPYLSIKILPHVEVSDMPIYYAVSNIFVLPSHEETWGLVVNEAMACGLPIIVTDKVGSSIDLVQNGKNGYIIPSGNVGELKNALQKFIDSPKLRYRMGRYNKKFISTKTPDMAAGQFYSAIQYVYSST